MSDAAPAIPGALEDLTSFQRDLLLALGLLEREREQISGQDIQAELHARGYTDIRHGRLYPNLDELVASGLVAKGQQSARTNDYGLTDRGGELLAAYRETLAAAAGARVMADGGQVQACPECNSSNIETNSGSTDFGGEPTRAAYSCRACNAAFDEPTTRPPLRESGSCVHGTAKTLLDGDADELVPDGGRDPVLHLLDELQDASEHCEPSCLVFDNEDQSCVVRWGDGYRYLSSGLLYARECSVADIRAAWDSHGEPRHIPLKTQRHRFDREDFADVAELVTDGGVRYEPVDSELEAGDVVVDLASGTSLQVVSIAIEPAGEHPQTRSDDTAAMFDADPDEPVYNCVFLPDGDRLSPPSKTYAYPESRLLRYPVERATDGHDLQTHLRAAVLTTLLEAATDEREVETIVDLAGSVYGHGLRELLDRHCDREEVAEDV